MITRDHFDGIVNATDPQDVRYPYRVTIPTRTLNFGTVDWLMENIGPGFWTWGYQINDLDAKIDVSTIVVSFRTNEDAFLFNLIFRE